MVLKSQTRHDVKRFVMTSKIRQTFVMQSKICHDLKKFVVTSKTRHDIKHILALHYISTICRPRVINDYVFITN